MVSVELELLDALQDVAQSSVVFRLGRAFQNRLGKPDVGHEPDA